MKRELICKGSFEIIQAQTFLPYVDIKRSSNTYANDFDSDPIFKTPDKYSHDNQKTRRTFDGSVWQFDKLINDPSKEEMLSKDNESVIDRVTVVCEKYDNKISLKFYFCHKQKRIGIHYFKKESHSYHFTFNTKTKDFFMVVRAFRNRKRICSVKRNFFHSLFNTTETALRWINSYKNADNINIKDLHKPIYKFIEEIVSDDDVFTKKLMRGVPDKSLLLEHAIMGTFINLRGIKVPNVWKSLLVNHYPGMRNFRKNKMKLVPAVLDKYRIKSKHTQRLLNGNPNMNITTLRLFFHLLGKDNIVKVDTDILLESDTYTYEYIWIIKDLSRGKLGRRECDIFDEEEYNEDKERKLCESVVKTLLDISEKRRIIQLLNNGVGIQEIIDHIVLRERLMVEYNYDHKIRYGTVIEFNRAHFQLTKREEEYKSNTYVKRNFKNKFIENVEQPIEFKGETYFPKVLVDSYDYIEEGSHQKHCISTYVNRTKSVIVSIRKGVVGSERVTCEFLGHPPRKFVVVQKKMKYNKEPDKCFETPISLIEDKFSGKILKDVIDEVSVIDRKTDKVLKTISLDSKATLDQQLGQPQLLDLPF